MSVTSKEEVRALVKTRLSDDDLQDVIDREEAWLSRRIGPLTGARTITYSGDGSPQPLFLPRPVKDGTLAVQDAGVTIGAGGLRYGAQAWAIERVQAGSRIGWTTPVAITFEPDDLLEVKRVVIELVRLAVTESGYSMEVLGSYTYQQNAGARAATRAALMQSLMGRRGGKAGTIAMAGRLVGPAGDRDPRINA